MQPSDWVSSGIAAGALVVAIIALVFSAKSAGAAQASADASEASALVSKQQHALELARDGIVEFGPWRAEAISNELIGDRHWRFTNTSNQVMHDLAVDAFGIPWEVKHGEEVKPTWNPLISYPEEHRFAFPRQVEVSWREGSAAAPKTTMVVWMHRPSGSDPRAQRVRRTRSSWSRELIDLKLIG